MKQSLYIYNNGDLKRKDNTLQFTTYEGDKRDIPIERISDIYILSEMSRIPCGKASCCLSMAEKSILRNPSNVSPFHISFQIS